jgi:hypothetical protein
MLAGYKYCAPTGLGKYNRGIITFARAPGRTFIEGPASRTKRLRRRICTFLSDAFLADIGFWATRSVLGFWTSIEGMSIQTFILDKYTMLVYGDIIPPDFFYGSGVHAEGGVVSCETLSTTKVHPDFGSDAVIMPIIRVHGSWILHHSVSVVERRQG